MRVVLTHPYCWPYVRRGTERGMDVLARHLVKSGHDVVTLSTAPDGDHVSVGPGGCRILRRPLTFPFMRALRIQSTHTFFFVALRTLPLLGADVVHSFYASDALAAVAAKRRTHHRTVLQMNGVAIPGVSCYRWLPPEGAMFREALRRVDCRITCSRFTRDLLGEHYGVDCEVIPPPIDVALEPTLQKTRRAVPTILSVADFNVRRKGVRVLIDAFCRVKRARPDARLQLSGRLSASLAKELLTPLPSRVRDAIELLGLGAIDDLPALYRNATVMALPAMWEPSGTVLFEALAAGTPVVATRHGGIPEFVPDDVGVLFDPRSDGEETRNTAGLADAILQGLALAEKTDTPARCRAQAARFAWPVLGPQIQRLYLGGQN